MNVTCAVILAAGFGTRMLPATKAVPKELMPLVDAPVIEYVVEEAVQSGIEHIVMVTSAGKRAVEDHFGRVHDLERLLADKGDDDRLARVRRSAEMADMVFVRQHVPGGIAHAVYSARRAVGDQPFVLMLPDDVIRADRPATRQLLDVAERFEASVVCVEQVPAARISLYGVIRAEEVADRIYRVEDLVEKPPADRAPSDLAIVGRYVLTPTIFDVIAGMERKEGTELQITDALARLLRRERLYAAKVDGRRYDTGQPFGFLRAGIELMLQRPEYAQQLREYLRDLRESDFLKDGARAVEGGRR